MNQTTATKATIRDEINRLDNEILRLANLGYAPYLLRHIREVAKGNTPSEKITSPGYMLYLAQSGAAPNVVNEGEDRPDGTHQDMKIKYRNRPLEDHIRIVNAQCDAISEKRHLQKLLQ